MLRLLRARLRSRGRVRVEGRPRIGRGVRFDIVRGGRVELGDGCAIGEGTRLHVRGRVHVGAGAVLGERCVVAAAARVEIGAGARLGDEVVLIDFDHGFADVERPVREQGLVSAPVAIGERTVLEAGATVLRGVRVGAGARVQSRAVVTRDVAPAATVGGVPARPVAG